MTSESETNLLSTATLAIWLTCVAVGVAGLKLAYPRPRPAIGEPPPVVAQRINVEITHELLPPPDMGAPATPPPPADLQQPPPPPDAPPLPAAPPLIPVAAPNPRIAAPIPVAGPTRIVAAAQAVPPAVAPAPQTQPVAAAPAPAAPAVQHITYGQGDGRQPAPEYPREAQLAHQQGEVVIRFTVDEQGRVVDAEATSPCPFPLLNQAALRAVRETWRFPSGAPRLYEVAVRFQLRRS